MKKSYTVDSTCNDMRIDRWTRLKIGKIPQGLIEKYLRSGKIKINKKKIKSSEDLNQAVKKVLESNQKTILLVIYNSQNQRRYIGIKLD